MALSPAIPRPTVPFLDSGRNQVSREWYLFLANIFATQNVKVGLTGDETFIDETSSDLTAVDFSLDPILLAHFELEQDVPPQYNDVPKVTAPTTPDLTLRGKCLQITAGITIPANVFSANGTEGHTFSVFNNSAGALTLTQGASLTLRLGGTATTGNRTIAAFGLVTLWFPTTTVCVAIGNVT